MAVLQLLSGGELGAIGGAAAGGDGSIELEDSQSQTRPVRELLVPAACWRAGERVEVTAAHQGGRSGYAFPNPVSMRRQAVDWEALQVRDEQPPAAGVEGDERAGAPIEGAGRRSRRGGSGSGPAKTTSSQGAGAAGGGARGQRQRGNSISEVLALPASMSSAEEKLRAMSASGLCGPCSWQPQWVGGPLVRVGDGGGCC